MSRLINPTTSFPASGAGPVAAPADPTPAASKRKKRSWLTFFRDVFLYFALYILISAISIGPLFWTWFEAVYIDGPKWFARLYLPLAFLCEIFPPLGRLVNAWIDWCQNI